MNMYGFIITKHELTRQPNRSMFRLISQNPLTQQQR